MPSDNSTIIINDEADDNDYGNTLPNNSQLTTQGARALQNSYVYAQTQGLAISEQIPFRQRRTIDNRKRNHAESEDELAGSTKHPRTRTYSATEAENWDTVLIEESSRTSPETVRGLLNASSSEIKRQRSRIGYLVAVIKQEREIHREFEKVQSGKYAALEKDFKALKFKMATILTANVEAFGTKVSDDTISGAWNQLCCNVQNIVSNYLTSASHSGISTNGMLPMRDILARRQLWVIICFHCFKGLTEHWYEKIGQLLAQRIDQIDPLDPPSHQYLKMISNMKSAFDPNIKENGRLGEDSEQNQAVIDVVTCFGDEISHERKEVFKRDVWEVIKQAANIHFAMMRSKAIFIVKWAESHNEEDDCEYDPETMISFQDGIDTALSSYVVDVNESPAVWKIGNADGENFDFAMVLCKSVVVVKEKKVTVVLE
ncbi:hypothetical protein GGI43DRAFT_429465 [Trichoderma evansii]